MQIGIMARGDLQFVTAMADEMRRIVHTLKTLVPCRARQRTPGHKRRVLQKQSTAIIFMTPKKIVAVAQVPPGTLRIFKRHRITHTRQTRHHVERGADRARSDAHVVVIDNGP